MKEAYQHLDKAFESRIRLGIMSALIASGEMDFNELKTILQLTDGNLASHLKSLEKLEYISVEKQFIGRKPNTRYKVNPGGKQAFTKHLKALEEIIKSNK